MAECRHEIEAATCGICTPRPGPPREPRRLGPWFPARYPGKCTDCGEWVGEGDEIRSDGEGGWLCEGCGEDGPR